MCAVTDPIGYGIHPKKCLKSVKFYGTTTRLIIITPMYRLVERGIMLCK